MPLPIPRGRIYRDDDEKRQRESRNGYIQAEFIVDQISKWSSESLLTVDLLRELQRLAVNQIYRCAGHLRDGPVTIANVTHRPPDHSEVPSLVEEMCRHVRDNWDKPPIHLASYLMWRVNWIHPFFGGNGRTARAVSYLILCTRLGFRLPGERTVPDLIVANREPYQAALKSADTAWEQRRLHLSKMEKLMSDLLGKQLVHVHDRATGIVSTQ